jgi:DNA-binding transcriptional ArsR family regulator
LDTEFLPLVAMLYRSVKYKQHSLDSVFAALADPTRRAIAERLAEGPASMTELAAPFDVTLPAIVKHLAVLEHAGLVEHEKDGRVRYFALVPGQLHTVADWLERYGSFWRGRFDELHRYLDTGRDSA